ncbi:MAG: putative membrane-bound dehydrogenase-like protein [Pirellulaceae bacterium]|jgi:putative membrane-bound dehydrogenase-like protein
MTMRTVALLICNLLAVLAITAASTSGEDATLGLPHGVTNSQNPKDVPLTPQQSLAKISVPAGFRVTLFAGEPHIAQPIAFTFDDRGRLWVAQCFSHPKWQPTGKDRILIFEDTDNDGQFDTRKVFWDQGNYISALQWGHGGVWVGNSPNLLFIPDADRDDQPDGPPQKLLDGFSRRGPNNVINNLNWGPDGWLYGCIGQGESSFIGKPATPQNERVQISRGVWRYHPQSKKFEVVTRGAVNPWGLDFNDHGQAFFTNCVLAHLWHVIPGGHYERRPNEADRPHIYSRLKPCCDHLHWGGGDWTSSRGGEGAHSVAGGGHAHTGAMIYLGDNWPAEYRDTIFMGNLHGNRLNNDHLKRKDSGYVGIHGKDFLLANDPWFRCLSQKYGPDGGVFVTDWHDLGECHDGDGSHRSSGRIYKVVYGPNRKPVPFDLQDHDNEQLVLLQTHKNEWFVRHARRVLQERALRGDDMSNAHRQLHEMLNEHPKETRKLRALWALHVTDGISIERLIQLTRHDGEHVRAWSVRLLADCFQADTPLHTERALDATILTRFEQLAKTDSSPLVRLHLAAALSRLPLKHRWQLATELISRKEDADDANIGPMLWFGIEPLVGENPSQALALLTKVQIPILRQHIAQRASTK